jgi:hypothetical protein
MSYGKPELLPKSLARERRLAASQSRCFQAKAGKTTQGCPLAHRRAAPKQNVFLAGWG